MRRIEPARPQRAEVLGVEDGLPTREARPASPARRRSRAGARSRVSRALSSSIDQPMSSPTTKSREWSGQRDRARRNVCLQRRRARARSSAQHLEIAVGDVCERGHADRRAALSRALRAAAARTSGSSSALVEPEPALADELRMAAAAQERRRQPAGERLEQRVRARIVPARGEVDVVLAQEVGQLVRRQRADGPDPFEPRIGSAGERDLELVAIEMAVEPRRARRFPCAGCPTSSSRSRAAGDPTGSGSAVRDERSPGRSRWGSEPGRAGRARAPRASRGCSATEHGRVGERAVQLENRARRFRRRSRGRRRSARRRDAPCARRRARNGATGCVEVERVEEARLRRSPRCGSTRESVRGLRARATARG